MTKAEKQTVNKELEKTFDLLYNGFWNIFTKIIIFVFKTLFTGIKFLFQKKNKIVLILSVLITVLTVVLYVVYNKIYITIIPYFMYLFVSGIVSYSYKDKENTRFKHIPKKEVNVYEKK